MATNNGQPRRGGVFDVRYVISGLFGVYGIILVVWGLALTSPQELAKAAGVNINLWGGIAMLIFAALMGLWSLVRPIVVPSGPETAGEESVGSSGP